MVSSDNNVNQQQKDFKKNNNESVLNRVENLIVSILLSLVLILVLIQVFSRFITGNSVTWAGELSRFVAVWLIFIGSAIALRRNLHIQVENLYNVVSPKISLVMLLFRNIIIVAFLFLISLGSLDMLEIVSIQTSPGLGINMSFVYSVLPVAIILMIVILLFQTITRFRKKRG